MELPRSLQQFDAVDARHPKVGDEDVGRPLRQAAQRVFRAGGLIDHEPLLLQK